MRAFRRLPPLVRAASIAGLVFGLAASGLLILVISSLVTGLFLPLAPPRLIFMAIDLLLLGVACFGVVSVYSTRFRRSDQGPFPLDTWQSQMRTIALCSTPPLCGIALALVIPLTSPAIFIIFPIVQLAILVMFAVFVAIAVAVDATSDGSMPTPPAG